MHELEDVLSAPAWALIRGRDAATVRLIAGRRTDLDELAQLPLQRGRPRGGPCTDSLVLVPYAQLRERGFAAHQDGTPLSSITVEQEHSVPVPALLAALPSTPVEHVERGGFEIDDQAYAALVAAVLRDEIGNGEGANLVLARRYAARLAGWGTEAALSVLRRLLTRERGAYWTYCVFTGDRYLLGASPERHLGVDGDWVSMNPISGTYRLAGVQPAAQRQGLLEFLADEKEIYELFMVVDEELKMMCEICDRGGVVVGPYLRAMAHLVHTEYLLAGRTTRDVRAVLRDSMFAATVTGSPVRNACRLIARYETSGRGYYGATLALVGRNSDGTPLVDAPILIRTADVDLDGRLQLLAGATLVRDSDPHNEVAETHAKAAGVLSAFGLVETAPHDGEPTESLADLDADAAVRTALAARNSRLSRFWLTDQQAAEPESTLAGRSALIVDGEDDFVAMLRHVLGVLGLTTRVVGHADWTEADLASCDVIVLGPGPGDPRDRTDAKIRSFVSVVQRVRALERPLLAVCLGHQVLCAELGFDLAYKDAVFQGTQSKVSVLGRSEVVGFYNTFVARAPAGGVPAGVRVDADPVSGDVHLVSGAGFRGVQFHAESILTQHGPAILADLLRGLLHDVGWPPSLSSTARV